MTSDYWKSFWEEHARASLNSPSQYQVLRTLNKQPLSEARFARILAEVEKAIDLKPDDCVLDLCCGNGMITTHLASKCKSVVGVDYSKDLLSKIDPVRHPNITALAEDVSQVELPDARFTKVLIYAGIQYFSERQVVCLFDKVFRWMRSNGLFYLGDIPDEDRKWAFFNSQEREGVYFESIRADKPIIGTWLRGDWVLKLARQVGFVDARIIPQPADFPFAHYRFDMVMKKA